MSICQSLSVDIEHVSSYWRSIKFPRLSIWERYFCRFVFQIVDAGVHDGLTAHQGTSSGHVLDNQSYDVSSLSLCGGDATVD